MANSKRKQLIIASPVFLTTFLILILGGFFWWLKQKSLPSQTKKTSWENIQAVVIKTTQQETTLQKENSQWIIISNKASLFSDENNNIPADKNKINELLDSLEKFDQKELVSQNKEKHSLFQVNQDEPLLTLKFTDQPQISFIVGKYSYSRGGTYVRLPEKDQVFLMTTNLTTSINQEGWENLRLLEAISFETEKVALSFPQKQQTAIFEKDDQGNWKRENRDVDKEKIKDFLSSLDYFEGKTIHLKKEKHDQLTNTKLTLVITNEEGKETKINFYSNNEFLASKDDESFVYSLSEEKYQSLEKEARDLISLH